MDAAFKRLQALDLHPKLAKDFAVRTKSGAAISISAIIVAFALFLSEFLYYRGVEKVEHMEVDPIRGAKMRINFDVTFPDIPCAGISLDAMDASGQHQVDILHDVFKRRIDAAGNTVGMSERGELKKTITSREALLKEKQKAIAEGRTAPVVTKAGCGDCYGAGDPGQCCDTCEDVRNAYRRKGWQFDMKVVEQCNKEGLAGDLQEQIKAGEGCNMYGHLEVPKVAGHFHFAPAHNMQHAFAHVHDLVSFTVQSFNITHKVNTLSFGDYLPGVAAPLDGLGRILFQGSGMHQYFVKLVPTVYQPAGARPDQYLNSYQFSVTEHLRKIDLRTANMDNMQGLLPGVFFHYDLSPMRVRIEEQTRSFGHFLTRVFAIIGGVFTVMGLVDQLLFRITENAARGKRTGGLLGGLL